MGVASPHLRRREASTWSSGSCDVTREAERGGAERSSQWMVEWAGQRQVRGDSWNGVPGMVSSLRAVRSQRYGAEPPEGT